MQIIDIHTHITSYPEIIPERVGGGKYLSYGEHQKICSKLGVNLSVLLPIVAPEAQYHFISNEEAKVMADDHPENYVWFCNVDPRSGENSEDTDFERIIAHYKSLGARGLGELTSHLYADDPKMDKLFAACAKLDMPVLIHISPKLGYSYGIVDDPGLPRISKMLSKHKNLKMIGHSAAFWSEIGENYSPDGRNGYPQGKVTEGRLAKMMREFENLYCDFSAGSGSNAMMRDPEYAAKFINEFSDRLMFGCDICSPGDTFMFDFKSFLFGLAESGKISNETLEKIMHKNAEKLLKL